MGEFAVWIFLADEYHFPIAQGADAKTAVDTAMRAIHLPAGKAVRVIITDSGDHTCFEWIKGKGVTFPRKGTANDHTQSAAGNG